MKRKLYVVLTGIMAKADYAKKKTQHEKVVASGLKRMTKIDISAIIN
jgi:hypothetical protein